VTFVLRRRVALLAYVLALAFIAVATLRPAGRTAFQGWSLCIICPSGGASEAVQNLLLFVPFGIAAAGGVLRLGVATFLGFAISLLVECAQMVIPGRDPNFGDLVFNTLGTALGWLMGAWARILVMSWGRSAVFSAIAAATATLTALAGGAWLLQPSYGVPPYRVQQWTSDRGTLLEAWLGDLELQPGELPGTAALALATRATLRVRAVGDTARRGVYWLRVFDGRQREVVSVRKLQGDVQVRYRTNAADLSLELTESRARGVLARYRLGDTIDVSVTRDGLRHCAVVERVDNCGFGPTLASSWAVVEAAGFLPPWALVTMDAAWLGLLFLPVGFALRRDKRVLAAAAAAVAGLWFVPRIFELESTRITDLIGVAVALIVAGGLSYYLRREPGEGHRRHKGGFGKRASAGARR
jgi:hypothetical protein